MAEQTFTFPASTYGENVGSNVNWTFSSPYPQVNADLTPGSARYFRNVTFFQNGFFALRLSAMSGSDTENADLSTDFEATGTFESTTTRDDITIALAGMDMSEPYSFVPSNSSEVTAFYNAHIGQSAVALTVVLNDNASEMHTVDAGDANFAFETPEPTRTGGTRSLFEEPALGPGDTGDIGVRYTETYSSFVADNNTRWQLVAESTPTRFFDDADGTPTGIRFLVGHNTNDRFIFNLNRSPPSSTVANYNIAFRVTGTGTIYGPYALATDDGTGPSVFFWTVPQATLDSIKAVIDGGGTVDFVIYDLSLTDDLPQWNAVALTYREQGAVDYAADAGDASWDFDLPELSVTYNQTHEENAGDVNFAFVLPQPSVTVGFPDLALSSFDATDSVFMQMRISAGAFVRIDGSGQENIWSSNEWTEDEVTPGDGAGQVGSILEGSPNVTGLAEDNAPILRRIAKRDTDNRIIINAIDDGMEDIGTLFDSPNDPFRLTFVIQGSPPQMFTLPVPASDEGDAFANWQNNSQAVYDLIDGLMPGDQFIVAIHSGEARYNPRGIPRIIKTRSRVEWEFEVEEPTVSGPPTAVGVSAPADFSIVGRNTISLQAVATVTNPVGATTYQWTKIAGVSTGTLSDPAILQPDYTAVDVTGQVMETWRITVTNNGVSDSDDVTITITPDLRAPVFTPDIAPTQNWMIGVFADYEFPNPNGNPGSTFTVAGLPQGLFLGGPRRILGFPQESGSGDIIVTADNGQGTGTFTIPYVIPAFAWAQDAGDANWTFALPIPSALFNQLHEESAGDAFFAFDLPQPTITRLQGRDAGDADWMFDLPQPSVALGTGSNAGDANFVFDLPEPQITRRRFRDAGDVNFFFNLPQPSITAGGQISVSAGDANFAFATPQPSITRFAGNRVDAGDVGFTFDLPQPTVTSGAVVGIDPGDAEFLFDIPEPTVNVNIVRNAGDVGFAFVLPQPSIATATSYSVDAGDVDWEFRVPLPGIRFPRMYTIDADNVVWIVNIPELASFNHNRLFVPLEYKIETTTDLLISQWQNSFNLKTVVQIFLDIMQEELIDPMNRLQLMKKIDTGEGVWLDYIGERLGIIRPWITITTDARFGFDDAGVGFDQARFADAIGALEPRTPIGDRFFRELLKARVITIRADGGITDYLRSIQQIDSGATIVDGHDMTVTITTTRQSDLEIAERVEAIAKPAGVGRTFA